MEAQNRFRHTSPTGRGGGPTRLGALVVGALALLTAMPGHAELRPYDQKPTVTLRSLPAIKDPNSLNANVRYAGGYEITPNGTAQVLGLSDLRVFPAGSALRVEAISDVGAAVAFDLTSGAEVTIDHLRGPDGLAAFSRQLADAEDIAYDPGTGNRYVSFERSQRVVLYRDGWRGNGEILPLSGLPVFPTNEGMEGLTLVGEDLLIGVEAGGFWRCPLTTHACIQVKGPGAPGFLYKLTSLEALGDGREVLALYRYFDPFTGPRNILRLLRFEGGRLVVAEDLLKVAPPLPFDNYEGVSAVRTTAGYRLYLICDGLSEYVKPKILIYDWTR